MKRQTVILLLILTVGIASGCVKESKEKSDSKNPAQKNATLPAKKQTQLGLYVTAAEAYDKWKADPENVKVLDVRTPEEYIFVGHPEMAWHIPLKIATYEMVDGKPTLTMKATPDFVERVKKVFKPTDTILVTCRSGGRSAAAVNLLADAGFKNVYNITDGFEGDSIKDPKSPDHGKRVKNGWKNSGKPWTYEPSPEKMLLPTEVLKPKDEK